MERIPPIEDLKDEARRLRRALAAEGVEIGHSAALERVARAHGHRDWNTAHAVASKVPPYPVRPGERVTGAYLGRPFRAEVLGLTVLGENRFRVTLDFDEAVDVVAFDSFSNLRKRVVKVIDARGESPDRTSDGRPHLRIAR